MTELHLAYMSAMQSAILAATPPASFASITNVNVGKYTDSPTANPPVINIHRGNPEEVNIEWTDTADKDRMEGGGAGGCKMVWTYRFTIEAVLNLTQVRDDHSVALAKADDLSTWLFRICKNASVSSLGLTATDGEAPLQHRLMRTEFRETGGTNAYIYRILLLTELDVIS